MDIEIAKEKLKVIDIKFFLNGMIEQSNYIVDKADEINIAIETVLSELEKKEAIIKLMAKKLVEAHGWFYSEFDNFTEKNWIDYFTKKVEREGK